MKTIKHVLVVFLMMLISGLFGYYLSKFNPKVMTYLFLIVGFFIFNLIIRNSLSFKSYFTSRYNLLTAKFRSEKSYDIPKKLMFEKIIEVINHSDFKLIETDENKLEILAISKITFKSWGENLYFSFEAKGSETIMKFCSSTLLQIYSFGKNEKNYQDLLNKIESSLII